MVDAERAAANGYRLAALEQFKATGTIKFGDIVDPARAKAEEAKAKRENRRKAVFANEAAIPGAHIVPAYLSIKKPYEFDAGGANYRLGKVCTTPVETSSCA